MKKVLVTGAAGFIGYHVSKKLLAEKYSVVGIDDLNEYYDVKLKKSRQRLLIENDHFEIINKKIEDTDVLNSVFKNHKFDIVIHLAAQAGVRYSLEDPLSYIQSNIVGTTKLLEAARKVCPEHLLLASSSSVYGAAESFPYNEKNKVDHQLSIYAATKKSTENIAHSYSHLYKLPITMCRFFTVYGPWGRPDMALFKFTEAIMNEKTIDVYNDGNMKRDFTYIDDLVEALFRLTKCIPIFNKNVKENKIDTLSSVAPYRVVNIGNAKPEKLTDFISALEIVTGIKAKKKMLPLQLGDVPITWADSRLLFHLTGYRPSTQVIDGVRSFINWYNDFYR